MQKIMKPKIFLALGGVLLGAWIFAGPYMALNGLKNAVRANDAVALAEYIDFPAVKANLKAHFAALIGRQITPSTENNPFAALSGAMASAFVGPMVDALVTPESLATIMSGQKRGYGYGVGANGDARSPSVERAEIATGYAGLNLFVVSIYGAKATVNPTRLVFYRQGLFSWRVVEIELPAS